MLSVRKNAGLFVLSLFVILGGLFSFGYANAQELVLDVQTTAKAEVVQILGQERQLLPGTDVEGFNQTLKVRILEGEEKDSIVTIENDYTELKEGDVFYLIHTRNAFDSRDYYSVSDPYRLPALYFFIGLFIFCVIAFGGIQGLRGLIALAASFLFIFLLLLPAVLQGYSPILVSMGVAALIVVLGSYITHGFNRTTTAAVLGMIVTICVTGALAYVAVHMTKLSGFSSDEAIYLNFNTRGSIDFVGLLLGGILIGLLGVLYDAAIGQSIAVEELYRAGPHQTRKFILTRALRIGREHIGALVNTLAIAYVGVSLPLLLLFYSSSGDIFMIINREIFATEIIRTMVGSIGVVLTVPLTTLISVFILAKTKEQKTV